MLENVMQLFGEINNSKQFLVEILKGQLKFLLHVVKKIEIAPWKKKYNNRKMHLKNYVSICPIRHFGMILSIRYELFVFFLTLCWMLVINKQGLSGFSTWDFKKHVNGFFAKHVEKIFANVNEILMNEHCAGLPKS